MGKSIKSKIAKATGNKPELDKKALQMKKSWDEVSNLLKSANIGNGKKK